MRIMQILKDHLLPHRGNNHSPKLFAAEVVGELLLIIMLFQVAFVAHIAVVKNSDFLAAVLPTVLVTMTNTDRVEAGVGNLEPDALLARAAQAKADDMAANGYFAHRDPQGRDPWYWFDKLGYVYSYAGENLAVDFNESVDVEKAWMNSPAHKANIMKEKFTKVGIGVAKGMYKGKETTFVVQFFATPASVAIIPPTPKPKQAIIPTPAIKLVPKPTPAPVPKPPTPTPVATIADTEPEVLVATENAVEVGGGLVLGEAFIPNKAIEETVIILDEPEVKEPKEVPILSIMTEKFIEVASSPSTWYMPLLVILFTVLGISLAISLFVHMSKREVEGIALAMSVLVILSGLMYFNFNVSGTDVLVPSDSQSASVSIVFEDGFYFQK